MVLIGKNRAELTSIAEDLRRECEKMGLSINFSKTKVMTNLESLKPIKERGGERLKNKYANIDI